VELLESLWAYVGLLGGRPFDLGDGGGPKRGLIPDGIGIADDVDGRDEG